MSRRRDYPDLLTTILGMSLSEIEWREPKISRAVVARMKARAAKVGKMIADDWMRAAKARLDEIGRQVATDALDQQRRDQAVAERQNAERDYAETTAVINRLVEAELPVLRAAAERLRKHRRVMNRSIKRERQRLESEQRKLAKAKLMAFRQRHR